MIDINSESLIQFCKLPAFVGKLTGSRPSLSTFHRWRLKGRDGVQLETVLIGGSRYTSAEALNRFFLRKTAAADGAPSATMPSGGSELAAEYLQSQGI